MDKIKILWADDEVDLLKPHTMFLKGKGYDVITVTNGFDALEECTQNTDFSVVFLDESMPGMTGLETLSKIKAMQPNLPVVMITKNEAEQVMEDAIGQQIADYLIKPVNPNQILLTLKKIIDNKRLVSERTSSDYQQSFREMFMQIQSSGSIEDWVEVYKKIIAWELRLDAASAGSDMGEILSTQKQEANTEFSKFIVKNYESWFGAKKEKAPVMSHNLLRNKVLPFIGDGVPTVMLLLDNLRFDQWKIIEPIISTLYRVEDESFFYSILPTATQYSRNAIFAGLTPADIETRFPNIWLNDNEEGGKNMHEAELLYDQVKRLVRKPDIKVDYVKITNIAAGRQLEDNILNYLKNDFSVIVYNFIDMLSHARTEMEVLKELAGDETAYRSLTKSWFEHSPVWSALQSLAKKNIRLIITTDHGTVRVKTPTRVVGDKETTTNLRYKVGKNLQYDRNDVLEIRDPKLVGLPRPNISSTFIFAREDRFFLYPNNYNHYNNYYKNTFQHGGISLEEIICPVVRLRSK